MTTFNAPAFRLFFNTGKRFIETGAAWPNRAGTGFNVQLDSLFGSVRCSWSPTSTATASPRARPPSR